ncbi:MAG: cadherin-like beta sandwich domain-containing protein, partial [Bacilli bacterium]|nr:cadherin-like beta sandwich domain-containing protein [Bacilli bacterium]
MNYRNKKILTLKSIFIMLLMVLFIMPLNAKAVSVGDTYSYGYKNSIQTFTAPVTGYYRLETWGAQGGSYGSYRGGYGAYATGVVFLNKNDTLYIVTGGQPGVASNSSIGGGYNGGGSARTQSGNDKAGGGGGATHIATRSGLLSSLNSYHSEVLIVSAGGGGGYYYPSFNSIGGEGGGISGGVAPNGTCSGRTLIKGSAATQTGAGSSNGCGGDYRSLRGGFGYGHGGTNWQSGGGSGWFGGGSGMAHGGNGGSSYIGNSRLLSRNGVTKAMYCYSCSASSTASTYTVSTTSVSSTPTSNAAKSGSGAAKISILEIHNTDARIKEVNISGTNFSDVFDPDTYIYNFAIDPENSEVTITSSPMNALTTIVGNNSYTLPVGVTSVILTSTSESGNVLIYKINLTRAASGYQYLKDIKIGGNSLEDFEPTKLVYNIDVPYNTTTLDVDAIKGRMGQQVYFPPNLTINSGVNHFEIIVISEDGQKQTIYTLNVTKPHNSKLKSLSLKNATTSF